MRPLRALRELIAARGLWMAGFGIVFVGQTALVQHHARDSHLQPIAFNHSRHISSGLECTDCHLGARTQEHATIPELSICLGCHETPLTKSPEEGKIRAFAAARTEIPWRPVTHVPTHVYFSHRRHVTLAKIGCVSCHGAMASLTAPPSRPLRRLDMYTCIDCHRQKQARTDCNDCHR